MEHAINLSNKTLKALCQRVKCEATMTDDPMPEGWAGHGGSAWKVQLRYKGRRLTVPFYTGSLAGEPDAEGVIDCLLSDAQAGDQDFDEFCSDMGYDNDSRKAEKTWKACQALAPKIRQLLGDDFETFLYAER
jgi:hypothetical protein